MEPINFVPECNYVTHKAVDNRKRNVRYRVSLKETSNMTF